MNTSNQFQQVISDYLQNRASKDELFRKSFANPEKNLEECCKYILSEVYKSGISAFHESEIFSKAVHYYDEPSIEITETPSVKVVVNRKHLPSPLPPLPRKQEISKTITPQSAPRQLTLF